MTARARGYNSSNLLRDGARWPICADDGSGLEYLHRRSAQRAWNRTIRARDHPLLIVRWRLCLKESVVGVLTGTPAPTWWTVIRCVRKPSSPSREPAGVFRLWRKNVGTDVYDRMAEFDQLHGVPARREICPIYRAKIASPRSRIWKWARHRAQYRHARHFGRATR